MLIEIGGSAIQKSFRLISRNVAFTKSRTFSTFLQPLHTPISHGRARAEQCFVTAMKRTNGFASAVKQKKVKPTQPKPKEPDYCDVEPLRNDAGDIVWPAPENDIESALEFIKEWYVNVEAALSH